MEQLHHIQQLAENISQRIELIVQFYRQQERCNPPSFAQDAPEFVPHKIFAAVNDVLDATTELHDLFLGPSNLLRVYATVRRSTSFLLCMPQGAQLLTLCVAC